MMGSLPDDQVFESLHSFSPVLSAVCLVLSAHLWVINWWSNHHDVNASGRRAAKSVPHSQSECSKANIAFTRGPRMRSGGTPVTKRRSIHLKQTLDRVALLICC